MTETKKPLRLQRIVIAALLAQLIPLLVLMAVITVYGYLVSPAPDSGFYQSFAARAGKIVNPVVGSLATFGLGYWAARKPDHSKIMHGALTGVVVVFIEVAIFATPGPEFGLSEGLGMLAKLLAGCLGGYAAQRSALKHPEDEKSGHRFF
jgi:hypothetical protein